MKPESGARITLTQAEKRLASYLGRARHKNNRRKNVIDRKISSANAVEMDIDAIGAEIAFCRMFNVYPDMSIHVRSKQQGTDTSADCKIGDLTIDVKMTRWPDGHLLIAKDVKEHPDIYALMISDGNFTYEYKGFAFSQEVVRDRYITRMTDESPECYAIPQDHLTGASFWLALGPKKEKRK